MSKMIIRLRPLDKVLIQPEWLQCKEKDDWRRAKTFEGSVKPLVIKNL